MPAEAPIMSAVDLIRVTCPHCRTRLRVKGHLAGRKIRCPNQACGKGIDVAQAPAEAIGIRVDPPQAPAQPRLLASPSRRACSACGWPRKAGGATCDVCGHYDADAGTTHPSYRYGKRRRSARHDQAGVLPALWEYRASLAGIVIVTAVVAAGLWLFRKVEFGHGRKVQHGNFEIFYTAGATRAEADRFGSYLVKTWGAPANRGSVQLKKTVDGYQCRVVIKKEFQHDAKALQGLAFDGARISRDVFDGAPVEVHACDERLKTLQVFPQRADLHHRVVEGKVEVFFAAPVEKEGAQCLAKYLTRVVGDAPGPIPFKLARRGAVVEVYAFVPAEMLNDPAVIAEFQQDRQEIAADVFPGATVEMHLCDEFLNVVQVLNS
jgi:hypothetical protein